jgi:rhamnosyltransferase subunit B
MPMARIILVTIGSLGDLHPFIGVALALKELGHEPVMAVPGSYVANCQAVGLEAHGIFPDYESLVEEIGEASDVIVRKVMASQDYLIRQIMLRSLGTSVDKIDALVDGADLIITSMFALGAPIVAEKRNIPLAALVLQPIAILSAHAPSVMEDMPLFWRPAPGPIGRAWNRALCAIIRFETRRRYGGAINAVRHHHGLKSGKAAPLFDIEGNVLIKVATYDRLFATIPTDAPPNLKATGFPNFDAAADQNDGLPEHLEHFLAEGPPPIVFTLGSFAVHAPGNFYANSLRAARRMKERSVLLIGAEGTPPVDLGPDVCIVDYAQHSKLFSRARCIVHHGGIGTIGQALMAGKPQLVVPLMGDQPDNAARIISIGVGAQLPAKAYTTQKAAARLTALLADQAIADRAHSFGTLMIKDGAQRAAAAIDQALEAL